MKRVIGALKGKRVTGTKGFKKKPSEESCQSEARLQAVPKVNLDRFPRPEVFRDSFIILSKNFRLILLAVAISGLIHLMAGVLLIGVPLINPGSPPPIKVYSAFLAPVPSPSPPPPPPGPRSSRSGSKRISSIQNKPAIEPGKLVVPVEIPDKVANEDIADFGVPGGVEGGVPGGVPGGVVSDLVSKVIGEPFGETEEPVRAGGEIKPPRLIRRVEPIYPEIARQSRKEGTVILEATTDIYGRVVSIRVLRSEPLLDEAAIEAVRQWVYEPMVINGRPRAVTFTVTIIFKLQK